MDFFGRDSALARRSGIAGPSRKMPAAGVALALLLPAIVIGAPQAVSAHHSFAMFDNERTIVVTGQIREFQWVNPHTWIQLVTTSGGNTVEWSIEGRSPNVLSRRGWSRTSLKQGERISATIHPLKSGKPGGAIVSIRFADGRVLNADTPEAVDTNEENRR